MSVHDPGAVARIVYDAYSSREFERVAQWIADAAEIVNVATGERYFGRDGYLQHARGWAAAFPDLSIEIQHLGAGDDAAVVEYTFRGTHTGALVSPRGYVPPTWARVELQFCDALQVRDGKVVRIASYFDSASMLRQMGLLANSPLHLTERRASLGLFVSEVDSAAQQRNKAIVQRFLEEVVNQRNPGAAAATCAAELIWHGGSLGAARGLPAFQSALAAIFASFPDFQVESRDVTAEDDRVVVRVTIHGTQLGEFRGVAPTGRRVNSSGINGYRLTDGRIVEEWWENDVLGVMKQLDGLPAIMEA